MGHIQKPYSPPSPEVVMFWGAGATVELGAMTTADLAEALSALAGWVGDDQSQPAATGAGDFRLPPAFNFRNTIEERCGRIKPLQGPDHSWKREVLRDLLILLGDGNGCRTKQEAEQARHEKIKEMVRDKLDPAYLRRFGCADDPTEEEREAFMAELNAWPHRYDWFALKALMPAMSHDLWTKCRKRGPVNLQDLLTAIEQLAHLQAGLHGACLFGDAFSHFQIEPYRIPAIRECVALLTGVLQRLALQGDDGNLKKEKVVPYREFVEALVALNVKEARALVLQDHRPERRAFYLGSLAVISTNWDPLLQAFWFSANSRHNHGNSQFVPGTSRTLRLYHDQGPEVGLRHLDRWNTGQGRTDVFFAFGEAATQRLNREGAGNHVYRFNKLLQLHGGFHWRDCPRCGRIFTTAPNYEDETDGVMLGPSLLPEICRGWKPGESEEEQHEWRQGRFGSVQCIYCGYMTQPHDTPLLTQTVMKPTRHHLQWALFREMGLMVAKARHLLLVGYSLPTDDLINRCFIQSSASGRREPPPFVTVVVKDKTDGGRRVATDGWVRSANVWDYLQLNSAKGEVNEAAQHTVKNIVEVFGPGRRADGRDGFRVSLDGFPDVVDKLGRGSIERGTRRLLYPDDHGIPFPVQRSLDV